MSKSKAFYSPHQVKKLIMQWEKFTVCGLRTCRQLTFNSCLHPQEHRNLHSNEFRLQRCIRIKLNNLKWNLRFQRESLYNLNDPSMMSRNVPVVSFLSPFLNSNALNKSNIYCSSLQLTENTFSQPKYHIRGFSSNTSQVNNRQPIGDHLDNVYKRLQTNLPLFFVQPHDYSIYHKEIEFINNIRGTTSRGISSYVRQLSWVKIMAHLKFAYVKMEILKITKRPEDKCVIVRWSIRGVSGLKVMLQFWRYKPWQLRKVIDREASWYDGISTFYLGDDGLVHRHVCDKVIPDEEHTAKMSSPLI